MQSDLKYSYYTNKSFKKDANNNWPKHYLSHRPPARTQIWVPQWGGFYKALSKLKNGKASDLGGILGEACKTKGLMTTCFTFSTVPTIKTQPMPGLRDAFSVFS